MGSAGYIGSHTCKTLAARGYEPVTYDNLSRGKWAVNPCRLSELLVDRMMIDLGHAWPAANHAALFQRRCEPRHTIHNRI
jgi:nucleoside-diphosphate-sugar epimerase